MEKRAEPEASISERAAWALAVMRARSEARVARHWLQRKRNIWCKTAEPSRVRGTAGISKVWALTPCSLVLIDFGIPVMR